MVKTKKNFKTTILNLYKENGIKAFFRGLNQSLILVLNPVIQFVIYEWLKNRLGGRSLIIFLIGVISKAIATILTYPYQVVRTYS